MLSIQQLLFDALMWCRFYAANQSIGLKEMLILFYEAFQIAYEKAQQSCPEYFEISAAWAGATITLPEYFRLLDVIIVDDAGCTSGYAALIPNDEWDVREGNTRTKGTVTSPHARIDTTTITINPSMTGGRVYFFRDFSELDFTDQTQLLDLYMPLAFQPLLLSELMNLVQVRHFDINDDPSVRDRFNALQKSSAKKAKAVLKPLEQVEGITEKPTSIMTPNAQ